MHGRSIMHRDLKPGNVLCEDYTDLAEGEMHVKLADFGLSTKFDPDEKRRDGCGTYTFFAPELCNRVAYDAKVDVWAMGVIAYLLLTLKYPFFAHPDYVINSSITPDDMATKDHIQQGEPDYENDLRDASPEALSFIKTCFTKEAE